MSFGERVERREDRRLLTGDGRYTDDFAPHAAHAAFLRSEYAHARIVDIDVSGALDIEGVHAVYTFDDLDGRFADPLPLIIPHEAIVAGRTQYALARDEVRYVGETIAMVVARDRYVAEDAVERIRVDYEPLPVAAELESAAQADAPLVHSDRPDNVLGRVTEEHGDVDAALAKAEHVFRWRLEIERSASMPLEGRAIVARFDEAGALLVYDSTQAPTGVRAGLSLLFGLSLEQVQVVAPDVGGGFGVKVIQFYPEEVLVPLAAQRLGMPVKWTEDRREHFIGSTHERKQIHDVTVGVSADGRILGLQTSFLHDSGAYCPYGLIIPVITAAQLPGPYKLENYRYDFRAVFTNTVPTSPYRGAGPPARRVRDRARDGSRRRRARPRPRRDPAPQHDPAGRVPLRRRRHLPGRRADDLRLGRLSRRPAAAARPGRLRRLRVTQASGRGRGPHDRAGNRVLRRGDRHRAVRGRGGRRPRRRLGHRGQRHVEPGPGPRDDLRPDRRRPPRRGAGAHPRDDRRHTAARLGRRHVREPHGGGRRQRRPQGGARGARAGGRAGGADARGRSRGSRVRRRRGARQGLARQRDPARASSPRSRTRCGTRSARSRPPPRC